MSIFEFVRLPGILSGMAIVFVLLGPRVATPQTVGEAKPPTSNAKWDAYVEKFLNDYFAARPDRAVEAGKHEFDGQLPDWSEAGLRREIERLKAERANALAFTDDELDERRRFERSSASV